VRVDEWERGLSRSLPNILLSYVAGTGRSGADGGEKGMETADVTMGGRVIPDAVGSEAAVVLGKS
jgi:hypothetical protein